MAASGPPLAPRTAWPPTHAPPATEGHSVALSASPSAFLSLVGAATAVAGKAIDQAADAATTAAEARWLEASEQLEGIAA